MAVRYQIEGSTAAGISVSVEYAVTHGTLAPGESLPPVRQLAQDLGVSPNTVAAAYRQLRKRGVVETAGRNGTRVRWEDPADAIPAFLTIAIMPLSLSIADGLAFGFVSYAVLKALSGHAREVSWLVYLLAGLFVLRFALG